MKIVEILVNFFTAITQVQVFDITASPILPSLFIHINMQNYNLFFASTVDRL
jgi:hypothetical protein